MTVEFDESPKAKVFYRYDDFLTAPMYDEFESVFGRSQVHVRLNTYPVLYHTPKGVQLDVYGFRRFVANDSKKRFAHETIEGAKLSFIARKTRQIRILSSQLENAKIARKLIENDQSSPFDI